MALMAVMVVKGLMMWPLFWLVNLGFLSLELLISYTKLTNLNQNLYSKTYVIVLIYSMAQNR